MFSHCFSLFFHCFSCCSIENRDNELDFYKTSCKALFWYIYIYMYIYIYIATANAADFFPKLQTKLPKASRLPEVTLDTSKCTTPLGNLSVSRSSTDSLWLSSGPGAKTPAKSAWLSIGLPLHACLPKDRGCPLTFTKMCGGRWLDKAHNPCKQHHAHTPPPRAFGSIEHTIPNCKKL